MACYHPLKAVVLPGLSKNGKKNLMILTKEGYEKYQKDGYIIYKDKNRIWKRINKDENREEIDLPCSKCIGCRLDYSREWANRCMIESMKYKHNEFITLTYDPEHLPTKEVVDEDGIVKEKGTLVPVDLTKFMKDLRRYYQYHFNHEGIRFYACGEYGSKNERPHYHLIVFNLPVPDKKFGFTNKKGSINYHSDIIQKIWNKGLTSLCPVTWETCAYTARYMMKKQKGKDNVEELKERGYIQEFVRMSRDGGIGRDYYEQNKDKIYENDEIFIKKGFNTEKIRPSRFYDKLFDIDNPERMAEIKEQRKIQAILAEEAALAKTSLSKVEYRKQREESKKQKIKKLVRHFESGE